MPGSSDGPAPLLPDAVSMEVGAHLQLTVVELIALALAGKQLQWTAFGRGFLGVHRHLDDVIAAWRTLEDVVARRGAALGIALDGSAAAVLELDDHRRPEPGFTEVDAGLDRLCAQLGAVALRVRRRAEALRDVDAASQHVLVEVQRGLEDQLWMLQAGLAD